VLNENMWECQECQINQNYLICSHKTNGSTQNKMSCLGLDEY